MRHLLLAAVAATAIATPAVARDNSAYVGIEAGVMQPLDTSLSVDAFFPFTTVPLVPSGPNEYNDAGELDYDLGFDGDIIAGYDFGPFKAELELGYKRAGINYFSANGAFFQAIKARIAKFDENRRKRTNQQIETASRQIVNDAIISDEVIDVYDAAGIRKPDISILDEKFLAEI